MPTKEKVIMNRDESAACLAPEPIFPCAAQNAPEQKGFTLVELIIVIAILLALALIAIPTFNIFKDKARSVRAMEEIRGLEQAIYASAIDKGVLPDSLATIGQDNMLDPWGNPYVYVPNVAGGVGRWGIAGPMNDDFDLYSHGADGHSEADPTTSPTELTNADDIVRAEDGAWVGLGADY